MILDKRNTTDDDDRPVGYIYEPDEEGGWFFTWFDTMEEAINSLEPDGVDGEGDISEYEAREFLREELPDYYNMRDIDGDIIPIDEQWRWWH